MRIFFQYAVASDQVVDFFAEDVGGGRAAREFIDFALRAVVEDESGHGGDAETIAMRLVALVVDLDEDDGGGGEFACEAVDFWSERATRAAPRREHLEDDEGVAVVAQSGEVVVDADELAHRLGDEGDVGVGVGVGDSGGGGGGVERGQRGGGARGG